MRRFHFALLSLILVLAAQPLVAATYYVGTCKSGAFGTIQAAVNGVPPGSTIYVCPGTYAEQVVISQPLTLQGIPYNNSDQAIITVPSSGLTTTQTMNFGQAALQVQVTAGPVNIINITVDGTADSTNCPSGNYIGIFYNSGSSGTVNEVETRNQNCNAAGVGIAAQNGAGATQSLTIENSNVNNNSFEGIFGCSGQTPTTLNVFIKNNYVQGSDNGIVAYCNVGGSVSENTVVVGTSGLGVTANSPSSPVTKNTVIGGSAGIYLIGNGNVIVSDNTVTGATTYGIAIGTPGTVTSNHISNIGQDGIYVYAGGATIQSNTIAQSNVGIEFSCNTGTVSGNAINGAATGIDMVPASFNGVNKFYNVATVRTGGC